MAQAKTKQTKPFQNKMPKLTDQQVADIMCRYHEQLAAEYRMRDAIKRGKISPPPPSTSWCISDRD